MLAESYLAALEAYAKLTAQMLERKDLELIFERADRTLGKGKSAHDWIAIKSSLKLFLDLEDLKSVQTCTV